MKRTIFLALPLLFALPFGLAQAQSGPVAGKDYVEIQNGRPLDPPAAGTVVVEEFFSYVCPACNAFEPLLVAWSAKQPPYVKVVKVPATFRADFLTYAKTYYAAEALGLVEKTHQAVFNAIHVTHKLPAEGDKMDEEKIAAFYADYGVSKADFLNAMRSFGVDVKVRRATDHMQKSKVPSTPTLIVNGRYLVKGDSYQQMLDIAAALVEKEHAK